MRRTAFAILVLLMTLTTSAAVKVIAIKHGSPAAGCPPANVGEIINETWDGATEDNTWTAESAGGGTINDDSTTDPPLTTVDRFCTQQLEVNGVSSGRRAYIIDLCAGAPAWCDGTPEITGTIYVRFYLVLGANVETATPTVPAGGRIIVASVNDSAGSGDDVNDYSIAVTNTAGTLDLKIRVKGSTSVGAAYHIVGDAGSLTTKYRIEYWFTGSSGAWGWSVDGTTVDSNASDGDTVNLPRYLHVGWGRAATNMSGDVFIDNIAVSESPIGD